MDNYLLEFRFFGKAKSEAKRLIYDVNKKFHIVPRHRPVPHVTLVGPFTTKNEKKLISDFKELCTTQNIMSYSINGYGTFEDSRVVYLNIDPPEKLDNFRWNLAKRLRPYCSLRPFDLDREFYFHGTIAMKLSPKTFRNIKEYIQKKNKINYRHILLRVTLLKNSKILCEYDFLLKRMLNRAEAKNPLILTQTYIKIKASLNNKHIPILKRNDAPKRSFLDRIFEWFHPPKIFITSDLHLDHTNIITYCKRPFLNTKDMNQTLISNWNKVISHRDTVYFLGDIAYGKNSSSTDYWLNKLNGKIIFLKGNHDHSRRINFQSSHVLNYKENKFFLCHDPDNIPTYWKDWAIFGHHHNNNLDAYPFINKRNKRINVSVELTNYKPVDMDDLIKLIKD